MNSTETQASTIAFFGVFGAENLGNEASLAATLAQVRRSHPDAQLRCICVDPERVTNDHGLPAISILAPAAEEPGVGLLYRIRRLAGKVFRKLTCGLRAFRHLRGVDTLVIPGTGILDDFGMGPLGWPHDLLCWCVAARLRKAQLAFVCIGAGPIRNPVARMLMALAARMATYRSYRDNASKRFVQSLGIDVHADRVLPDNVFSLAVDGPIEATPRCHPQPTVAIGVMTYWGWGKQSGHGSGIYNTYIARISEFTRWVLDRGYAVRLVIGDRVDTQAVRDIRERVCAEGPDPGSNLTTNPIGSFEKVIQEMKSADVVVASRYHNVIAALLLHKPTISLSYAEKNDVLLAEVGLGRFCQHVQDFDVSQLQQDFVELETHGRLYTDRIAWVVGDFRDQLEGQLSEVLMARSLDDSARHEPVRAKSEGDSDSTLQRADRGAMSRVHSRGTTLHKKEGGTSILISRG